MSAISMQLTLRPVGRVKTFGPNPSRTRLLSWSLLLAASLGLGGAAQGESIVNSKHNLSASGIGAIKATTENDVCIFCHTPHGSTGEAPLWNRYSSGATYTPYNSTTIKAQVGQPTGSSKLCLSCHDGTIALGMVRSRSNPIEMHSGVVQMPPGRSRLGTDLADDHPISFTYDAALAAANGQLQDPEALHQRVRLQNGQMQCTSCHDAHNNQYGQFLVQDNTGSALCLECHRPLYWNQSAHRTSPARWNGQGNNPWPDSKQTTVAANACGNCHTPHNAGTKQRLLNHADEEQNCFICHSGNVAAKNVQSEFNKFSTHPIFSTANVHDPTEDTGNPTRHVTCADCHNPHASWSAQATAPNASGALAGVRGVNSAGAPVSAIARESELCYRCHADSVSGVRGYVTRQFVQNNTRLEFSPGNASFHPVETMGRNTDVPSLLTPWTTSSLMYCTDCHNNNQGPDAGGAGPRGPHGSAYAPLLERQLALTDFNGENSATYALCYKCHNRSIVLNEEQSFSYHALHVVDIRAACTTCHDPHGVQSKTHLINFNRTYVQPSTSNGRLEFIDTGRLRGNCSLTCHGKDHNALGYSSGAQVLPAGKRLGK